jgi:hypothetical protein
VDESEDHDYDLDLDTYRPVQPLSNDHGVSFFPISAPHSGIDHHILQVKKRRSISLKCLLLYNKEDVKIGDILFYIKMPFSFNIKIYSKISIIPFRL